MPALRHRRHGVDIAKRQRPSHRAARKPLRRKQPRHDSPNGGGRLGHRALARHTGARRRGGMQPETDTGRLAKRTDACARAHGNAAVNGERADVGGVFEREVGGVRRVGKNPLTGYNKQYHFIKQANRRRGRLKSVSGCLFRRHQL